MDKNTILELKKLDPLRYRIIKKMRCGVKEGQVWRVWFRDIAGEPTNYLFKINKIYLMGDVLVARGVQGKQSDNFRRGEFHLAINTLLFDKDCELFLEDLA